MDASTSQDPPAGSLREVGSLVGGETGKAVRYLRELELARSKCAWQDVPELARKVQKHAPHRHLLVLAERSEVEIINFLRQRSNAAQALSPPPGISALPTPLGTALNDRNGISFDKLRATVVLSWILWVLNEPQLALERLFTIDFDAISEEELKGQDMKDSKHDTVIEGYLLKGTTQESTGQLDNAIGTYIASLPYLSSILSIYAVPKSPYVSSPQFNRWAEQILSRLCGLLSQRIQSLPVDEQGKALEAFRLWAKFCHYQPKAGLVDVTETGIISGVKRRDVWKAYYDSLSIVLRHNAQSTELAGSFVSGSGRINRGNLHARQAQRAELKRIEDCYESLLLEETLFPKANQRNDEVERWVEAVIANWRIFCGPDWQDEELGGGGKIAVGKGVLEILYRAATKTFHSTQILRYLFTVHSSLAEFDLAFKAFNSYIDIVNKGKARAKKSGERQADLDDDDTVLFTAAEAIKCLCQYGSRAEVEKALSVCENIDLWLSDDSVSPQAAQIANHAMGIARAHWARLTFENTTRTAIQEEGLQHFRKAMDAGLPEEVLETAFSLGLLLAETRDLLGAINLLKGAISTSSSTARNIRTELAGSLPASHEHERRLCSLWHLLALLLSAKSDFAAAERICDAAFDQFGDETDLFGQAEAQLQPAANGEFSEKDMAYGSSPHFSKGIVDRMEANEKEGLVQIKITQLALLEVIDGPIAAIEVSHELLGLYGRLLGDPGQMNVLPQSQGPGQPPKTPSSTVKSAGGSIIGRPKSARRKLERHSTMTDRSKTGSLASRPSTAEAQATPPPMIQVISEDGNKAESPNAHRHSHLPFRKSHNTGETMQQPAASRPKSYPTWKHGGEDQAGRDIGTFTSSNSKVASGLQQPSSESEMQDAPTSAGRPDQPLPFIPHNMPPTSAPPPPGHSDQPPRQDVRLPTAPPGAAQHTPEPRFTTLQEYRRKTSLLVKVWLFIAGLYTRAALMDDARGAIDEAQKLVEGLEMQVSQESSSSKAFAEDGWGLGQSVDELWADVYAERGAVAEALSSPHEALAFYEQALAHFPDHSAAVVSLSGILLDIYCQKIPPEPVEKTPTPTSIGANLTSSTPSSEVDSKSDKPLERVGSGESPEALNRLAARDRAYKMLSTLTKLGTGWDNSEAWYMLARTYEESGQIEKAKEVLWWCVELEDGRPLRHWRCVGTGSFVL